MLIGLLAETNLSHWFIWFSSISYLLIDIRQTTPNYYWVFFIFVDPFAGDAFYSVPASCQTHILKSYTTGNARSRYEIFNIAYGKKSIPHRAEQFEVLLEELTCTISN